MTVYNVLVIGTNTSSLGYTLSDEIDSTGNTTSTIITIENTITYDLIKDYDGVYLNSPGTRSYDYTSSEYDAIIQYVSEGKGFGIFVDTDVNYPTQYARLQTLTQQFGVNTWYHEGKSFLDKVTEPDHIRFWVDRTYFKTEWDGTVLTYDTSHLGVNFKAIGKIRSYSRYMLSWEYSGGRMLFAAFDGIAGGWDGSNTNVEYALNYLVGSPPLDPEYLE